jgi:hypothetical protein
MADKIILGGDEDPTIDEAVADATITPGDLIKRTSTGVIRHATAAGNAMQIFAINSASQNRGIDSDYVAAEIVPFVIAESGTVINARVAAAATAIAVGDFLESAGNGTLRKHVAQSVNEAGSASIYTIQVAAIVGIALEAIDNSGGGTAVRIRAEIR